MTDTKFCLEEIDKTFTNYNNDKIYSAIVVSKNSEGAIVNVGGKTDAIILKREFEDFDNIKIGDKFNVISTKTKNEDGVLIVSKNKAEVLSNENEIVKGLKLGSVFSFVAVEIKNNGLYSKLGEFNIYIPHDEIDVQVGYIKNYLNKQYRAVVTEINNTDKIIIASIKILKQQEYQTVEINFWKSIFINKVVDGTVEKILPYGAFVDVDGITCFAHISDLSHKHIDSPEQVLNVGEKRKFRVVKIDREAKKVNLGIKQLEENPKLLELKKLKLGDILEGKVIKLLPFGVIVEINENLSGLLHIKDATEDKTIPIHHIFRLDSKVKVMVNKIDLESQKLNFALYKEN